MFLIRICAALAASALAACAALQPPAGPAPGAPAFDLIGRVAVIHDGRAFSSGVRWQHSPQRDELWLLTPTGQTLAYIVGDAGGAALTGGDQRQLRAADVESLTRKALGWELPLARLTWWVQGQPVPGAAAQGAERDEHGRLTTLAQESWRIAFAHFPPAEHGGRPRRLELASGAQEIRLVIDGWR